MRKKKGEEKLKKETKKENTKDTIIIAYRPC